jgi:hypothetical protein
MESEPLRQIVRPLIAVAALTALTGCMSERMSLGSASPTPQAAPPPAAPPTDLAGRWRLSAVGGSGCAMSFSGGPAAEGTIRPEGGCPGEFYTSRRWTFEQATLVIRDHNSAPLGQFRMVSPEIFEGQSTAGQALTLNR